MRYTFGHARASRQQADNVLAQVVLPDGSEGWGEAVPREYVTGETIESIFTCLQSQDLSFLPVDPSLGFKQLSSCLWELDIAEKFSRDRLNNAAACAIETALLDCFSRREERQLIEVMDLLSELEFLKRVNPLKQVRVSIAIPDDLNGAFKRAGKITHQADAKVKVGYGIPRDCERLDRVQAEFGTLVKLRGDANGVWKLEEAIKSLKAFIPYNLECIEEPLTPKSFREYATLRNNSPTPIMLDESLCSMRDAVMAHESGAADLFNLRISKCGGILGTLRLAAYAKLHGIGFQIGAMVGETGLLSSLGRSLTSRLKDVKYLESAVPKLSLQDDITDAELSLQSGNRLSSVPCGPGFGANIEAATVQKYRVKQIDIPLAGHR